MVGMYRQQQQQLSGAHWLSMHSFHAVSIIEGPSKCCRDVRASVDLCHRDGSLKQAVAKDPAKYIHEDKRLLGIMDMYRAAGKKLFVATNSLWDYTHVVMNFLLAGRVGSERNEDWLEYFDVVITGQTPVHQDVQLTCIART